MCRFIILSLLASASTIVTTPAMAQVAPADSPSSDQVTSEIVVTAQRRSESVTRVPIAITAFDQKLMDQKGIRSVGDIGKVTPGLTFTPSFGGATKISIRGISSDVGAGTTGVYIDDTPIQVRSLGASNTFTNAYPAIFDVTRVEVLRGPQGTLFGAGSEGGTVRFITPEPGLSNYTAYARSELATTKGGDATGEVGAALGGPIVRDQLGFRLSGSYRSDGGWVDRANPDTGVVTAKNTNRLQSVTLRGVITYQPVADLKITPSIYYQRQKRSDTDFYWRDISSPSHGKFLNGASLSQPASDRYYIASLNVSGTVGPVSITSNTSYFDRKQAQTLDYTNFIAELLGIDYRDGDRSGGISPSDLSNRQKSFTQELRVQSANPGRLRWILGFFYQDSKQYADQDVSSPSPDALTTYTFGASVTDFYGLPPIQPGNHLYTANDFSHDKQVAGFGQLDFEIVDRLTLSAGVRVAKVDFSTRNAQDGPLNGGPTGGSTSRSETPVTPRFSLEYKLDSGLLLYTSAAKGFRPGGGNSPVPTSPCQADLASLGLTASPGTFGSDSVWSYEAGAKGHAFNRKLRVEASGFLIDWSNIQQLQYLSNCGFSYIANLGAARSKGFDIHVNAMPLAGLSLDAAIGYTKARFTKTVTSGAGIVIARNDPLNTAPWTVALSADYSHALDGDFDGFIHAEYNYAAGYSFGRETTVSFDARNDRQFSSELVNLRLGVRSGGLELSVFANNLINTSTPAYVDHQTVQSDLFRIIGPRPRTIGATLSYRM